MNKDNKICFIIMGFGKKTDYATNRPLDLDKTYKNIIKPAVENSNMICIRADEVLDSAIIDKSMYALIMKAELVIADISTYNPNVLYELGIRHAVKPYSTIIIKENGGVIPFDLSHNRIFEYEHLGNDIGTDESTRCIEELSKLIKEVLDTKKIDSPLYDFLKLTNPPLLNDVEYDEVIDELSRKEKNVFAFVEKAKKYMEDSNEKNNRFLEAAQMWAKVAQLVPNESYFVQQFALCTYKSKKPSEFSALCDALSIINELNPDSSNDTETLGIAGAICRRLYEYSKDVTYLDRAIRYYKKGYDLNSNHYNGENYAFCLDLKRNCTKDYEEKIYYKIEARKTREKIVDELQIYIGSDEFNIEDNDKKWIYASLSNCKYALEDDKCGQDYEEKFKNEMPDSWEVETFEYSKKKIFELRN